MASKNEKIFVVATSILVIIGLVYSFSNETLVGSVLNPEELNWNDVHPRHIIKSSIPITLLDSDGEECRVSAQNFDRITKHAEFIKGKQLEEKLSYDVNNETLLFPCGDITDEKLRLVVWYVSPASDKFPGEYDYFLKEWIDYPPDTFPDLERPAQ